MDDGSYAVRCLIYLILILCEAMWFAFGEALRNYVVGNSANGQELTDKFEEKISLLKEQPTKFVDTIQVIVTLLNFFAGFYYISWFLTVPFGLGYCILLIFFLLVLGVLLPKKIGSKYPRQIIKCFYGIVSIFVVLLTPFTFLVLKCAQLCGYLFGIHKEDQKLEVTEEEIIAIVNEGQENGVLMANEVEMITNIFELSDKEAKDISTNRNNIVALDCDCRLSDALHDILNGSFSRYPVYEEDIDHIIGILHIKDVVKTMNENPEANDTLKNTAGLIREAVFVPETKSVNALFGEMQSSKTQMVIVVDEYGQTSGVVAMEDILEEIVGNIQDEYDADGDMIIKKEKEGSYLIDGLTRLEDLMDELNITFEENEFETINGYLINKMEKIPEDGDDFEIDIDRYHFKVIEVEHKMIKTIEVTLLEPKENENKENPVSEVEVDNKK